MKALQIFNSMKKEETFKHTLSTYRSVIEKLGLFGKFDAMEQVLVDLRRNIGNHMLEGVYVGVMKSYGKKGRVQEAVNVFERMDFYDCEPTVFSYNAIMSVLVDGGYFDQAHKVYMRMRDRGITPDVYSFTIRMKSFCKTGRPHAALRLLGNMSSQGCEVSAVAYCTVVGGFF